MKVVELALVLFSIYLSCPVLAQNYYNYTSNVPVNNYYQNNTENNDCTDYPSVSIIEKKIFGSSFQNENIYQRLNRLEGATLGTNFPSDALCDRIDRINKAVISNTRVSTQQYINQYPVSLPTQFSSYGYNDNSSYNNQYSGYSQPSSGIIGLLQNILLPMLTNYGGGGYYNNNYMYGPGYAQDYSEFQNSNFGAACRILP